MSRNLDDLDPEFKPIVMEFLARCVEAKAFVVIVNTLRDKETQEKLLKQGYSWTKNSKHLIGKAIDVCPLTSYLGYGTTKVDWDITNPVWETIGKIGEKIGLKWGVWKQSKDVVPAWRRRGDFVNIDLGHFEIKEKVKPV